MQSNHILFVNAGLENGGGLTHIISLLKELNRQGYVADLLVFADGPVAEAARQEHINVFVLDSPHRLSLSLRKRIIRFINAHDYNIVHTHGPRANMYLMLVRNQIHKTGKKWFVTVHSDPLLDFSNRGIVGRIFTKLNIKSLKKADGIFAVSSVFTKIVEEKIRIPKEKVVTIVNGIVFHQKEYPRQAHNGFNMIYVARMTAVKNHVLLLEAFKKADLVNTHLFLAGDGELYNEISQKIKELKLEKNVTMIGFQTQKQLTIMYEKIDLALLVSMSESFPLVLLEAADHHVPVLATNVGDVRLLIKDNELGFLIPANDEVALISKLRLANKEWSNGKLPFMGDKLFDYASNNFTISKQADSVLKGYAGLLKEV